MSKPPKVLLTPEQFERAVREGNTLADRSLKLARAMLVDGVPTVQAAEAAGVKPAQASQTKARVLKWHATAQTRKLSAEEFMAAKPLREARMEALRPEMLKLQRAGYPVSALVEYLAANDVTATADEVQALIEKGGNP